MLVDAAKEQTAKEDGLQDILEMLRKAKGAVVVAIPPDGGVSIASFQGRVDLAMLIGALDVAKFRLYAESK